MKKLNKKIKKNRGMTYVELIVVLGIFSVMSSVVLFNYGKFQAKVDIKNLANDIALKIVEAQKSAMSGKLQATAFTPKPAYGVYFNRSSPGNDKSFLYFADFNNDNLYDVSDSLYCLTPNSGFECLDKINITKGNSILPIGVSGTGCPATINNVNIVFTRPNSGALFSSSPALGCIVSFISINVASPSGPTATIKIYPSGRIQIN